MVNRISEANNAETARLREREADFTPRHVCRAGLAAAMRGTVSRVGVHASIVGTQDSVWPAIGRANTTTTLGGQHFRRDDQGHLDAAGGGPYIELPDGRTRVIRVLDICAGAGVWASEVRRLARLMGFQVQITAVDYAPEERPWLCRHADRVIIADWHEALGMVMDATGNWNWLATPAEYDLIVGNPAFSQARAARRPEWPQGQGAKGKNGKPKLLPAEAKVRLQLKKAAVAKGQLEELAEYDPERSMPALCLRSAPAVILYATQQCFTKTAAGWLTRLLYPNALAYDIPGSIGHRGRKVGHDDKPYTTYVWLRGHTAADPTRTFLLTPVDDRSWAERPGTEPDEWLDRNKIPFLQGPQNTGSNAQT